MTDRQIIGQIRALIGASPDEPDERLPRLVEVWGLRQEADGIIEGRKLEAGRFRGRIL